MEKHLEKIGFLAIVTVYLFVCGSLYTFFYWSRFSINITDLITVADIPKSMFTAFFQSISVVGAFILYVLIIEILPSKIRGIGEYLLNIAFTLVAINALTSDYNLHIIAIVLLIIGCIGIFFAKTLYERIREQKSIIIYLLYIIVFLNALVGFFSAQNVYENGNSTNYIKNIVASDTTLVKISKCEKLLGYVGDKIILSNKSNTSILVINQNSLNAITFTLDSTLCLK